MKLPNLKEKQQFATTTDFVIKHGNGKMIPGLDIGIHTMKGWVTIIDCPTKIGIFSKQTRSNP
jgi:hypothetical protein